jgi:hypothetical protein
MTLVSGTKPWPPSMAPTSGGLWQAMASIDFFPIDGEELQEREVRERRKRSHQRDARVGLEFFSPKYLHVVHLKMNGQHCS